VYICKPSAGNPAEVNMYMNSIESTLNAFNNIYPRIQSVVAIQRQSRPTYLTREVPATLSSFSLDSTGVSTSIEDESRGSTAARFASASAAFFLSRHNRNWAVAVAKTREMLVSYKIRKRIALLTEQDLKYERPSISLGGLREVRGLPYKVGSLLPELVSICLKSAKETRRLTTACTT
jgi:hypothetical protein